MPPVRPGDEKIRQPESVSQKMSAAGRVKYWRRSEHEALPTGNFQQIRIQETWRE